MGTPPCLRNRHEDAIRVRNSLVVQLANLTVSAASHHSPRTMALAPPNRCIQVLGVWDPPQQMHSGVGGRGPPPQQMHSGVGGARNFCKVNIY